MAALTERFQRYIRHERTLADNTRAAYRRDLATFADWLGGRPVTAVTVGTLGDYFSALSRRGLARASIARHAATLRTFFAFLQLEGVVAESPAAAVVASRRDDAIPTTLSTGSSPPPTPAARADSATGPCWNCSTPPVAGHRR